jgi:nucleoid DNA-binding protein
LNKTSLVEDIYTLSFRFSYPLDKVRKIIASYFNYCKDQLKQGCEVNISNLCTIVPVNLKTRYSTTLAYDCLQISKQTSVPYNTVFTIIDEYLTGVYDAMLIENADINLRGLCTLRVVQDGESSYTIHGHISKSLANEGIQARLRTNKYLKHQIRGY